MRLGTEYPELDLVGLDGDAYSLEAARSRVEDAGMSDRVRLINSGMEDLDTEDEYDVITINVSMHECRDIEKVTAAVYRALKLASSSTRISLSPTARKESAQSRVGSCRASSSSKR